MGSSWRRVSVKPNIFRNGDHTTGAGGNTGTYTNRLGLKSVLSNRREAGVPKAFVPHLHGGF